MSHITEYYSLVDDSEISEKVVAEVPKSGHEAIDLEESEAEDGDTATRRDTSSERVPNVDSTDV